MLENSLHEFPVTTPVAVCWPLLHCHRDENSAVSSENIYSIDIKLGREQYSCFSKTRATVLASVCQGCMTPCEDQSWDIYDFKNAMARIRLPLYVFLFLLQVKKNASTKYLFKSTVTRCLTRTSSSCRQGHACVTRMFWRDLSGMRSASGRTISFLSSPTHSPFAPHMTCNFVTVQTTHLFHTSLLLGWQ